MCLVCSHLHKEKESIESLKMHGLSVKAYSGYSGTRNGWLERGEGGKFIFTIHISFYDLKFAVCTCIFCSQK